LLALVVSESNFGARRKTDRVCVKERKKNFSLKEGCMGLQCERMLPSLSQSVHPVGLFARKSSSSASSTHLFPFLIPPPPLLQGNRTLSEQVHGAPFPFSSSFLLFDRFHSAESPVSPLNSVSLLSSPPSKSAQPSWAPAAPSVNWWRAEMIFLFLNYKDLVKYS